MTAISPKIDTNVLNTSTLENSNNASVASMNAGGSSANYFDVLEAWYPVHYVRDLDKLAPTKFTLLGQDIVIWWDNITQSWSVLEDKCPHRLAPNIKKIRTAIGFIGAISWALIPVLNQFTSTTAATSIASLTFLVISFTWYRLGKLEHQLYQGRLIPPRNLPEKPKK